MFSRFVSQPITFLKEFKLHTNWSKIDDTLFASFFFSVVLCVIILLHGFKAPVAAIQASSPGLLFDLTLLQGIELPFEIYLKVIISSFKVFFFFVNTKFLVIIFIINLTIYFVFLLDEIDSSLIDYIHSNLFWILLMTSFHVVFGVIIFNILFFITG